MKLTTFQGINNVDRSERLAPGELAEATNVDVDNGGQVTRRKGYVVEDASAHFNVFEAAAGFTLATRGDDGDLVHVELDLVVRAGLGHSPRVWCTDLPDGRVIFTNGTVQGIVSPSGALTSWGVPLPVGPGAAAGAAGGTLPPGRYRWQVTHVRIADGLEGGATFSAGVLDLAAGQGSIDWTGLPVLAGHTTNVYVTTADGEQAYFAGNTAGATFSFSGATQLVRPCHTEHLGPPVPGILPAFWRGRVVYAVGNLLVATRPHQLELLDPEKDVRQFSRDLTLVQPVDGGIWVGTETELAFLEGNQFDQLVYARVMTGGVVLGSGVRVDGDQVKRGQGTGSRTCMVCIVDGLLVAGYQDGGAVRLSDDRYRTDAAEVWATWRKVDGVPQYLATVLS